MGTAIEELNNAIARIEIETNASNASQGVKNAIHDMGLHWGKFWRSSERAILPDTALAPKLERYVRWYTRAYNIAPSTVKAKVPRPDQIDVQWSALALDAMRQWGEGSADAVKEAADQVAAARDYVENGAAQLAKAAADAAEKAAKGTRDALVMLGVVAIGFYFLTKD